MEIALDRRAVDPADAPEEQPVFVAGSLRSGTTLLGLILGQHPTIDYSGEWDFLFDILQFQKEEPAPALFREWLSCNRIFLQKKLSWSEGWSDHAEVVRGLVHQRMSKGRLLVANIHRNFHLADRYFPGAKFIHILRDPRDVASSTIAMGWAGNYYHAVDHWLATENSWNRLALTLHASRRCELKYERLVEQPEIEIEAICRFLQVPMESNMLQFHKHSTYSKIDPSLASQWKNKLSARQVGFVESKVSEHMKIRGYRVTSSSSNPSALVQLFLAIHDKVKKRVIIAKRHGLRLVVSRELYRLPGLTPLHRKTVQKINRNTSRYLK